MCSAARCRRRHSSGCAAPGPSPLVIEHVDAIDRADLAKRYGILTVPSTVVFAGGEARGINYGFATAEQIARQLRGDGYSI